ncbi:MAG: hypothetical protein Kow00103_08180 [Candidatus Caldatribacteriota bacterium]
MQYKEKILILILLTIILMLLSLGCELIFPNNPVENLDPIPTPSPGPSKGWIIIEDDLETTLDCSPLLSIYSEGAAYMSFSGDGKSWTDWVEYSNSYEEFNIANGLNGTEFGSGIRYVYVRFKDKDGNISSTDDFAYDSINYEMSELFSIKILPQEATVLTNGNCVFTLHGYDLLLNEVPLEGTQIFWSKTCPVGKLSPLVGLSTTYTAPSIPGKRDISAQYNNLNTGAVVVVVE